VKRLDNIRNLAIRGDLGATKGDCWYIKNKLWFSGQFEEIKGLVARYNQG
jgi:hypothetical protein